MPATDIFFETDEALTLTLEMPGVGKDNVDVQIENDVLRVEGRIDYLGTRTSNPSIRSTMSATTHVRSHCQTRLTGMRSRREWRTGCSH